MSLDRNEPVVHWCEREQAYLTIAVDVDERGRRIGECPYCGRLVWDDVASAVEDPLVVRHLRNIELWP